MKKRKKVKPKPKGKKSLTLYFDTEEGIYNFKAWYIDGGGEQQANYLTEDWDKDWMYLKASDLACPKCEYLSPGAYDDYDNAPMINQECEQCGYKYKIT